MFFVFAEQVGALDFCSVGLILEQNIRPTYKMKKVIFVLQILLAASCTKEDSCIGSPVTCTHTIYYGYQACPDPQDANKWKFSNCKSYMETVDMTGCDTSAWLVEARLFDESRKHEPNNPSWNEFARLYPNECGCK